jgi:hypothetical protein
MRKREENCESDYRMIADIMTRSGNAMNHATARNIILRNMERFACVLLGYYGVRSDPRDRATDPGFQQFVVELLEEIDDRRTGATRE